MLYFEPGNRFSCKMKTRMFSVVACTAATPKTEKQRRVFGAVMSLVSLLFSLSAATDRDMLAFRGPCANRPADTGLWLQQRRAKDCSQRDTVLLGGLFPLHSRGASTASCSERFRKAAFQSMEAMRFAIEQINAKDIIPGVRLDFEMRDTCYSPELTRQHALRFINRGIGSGLHCNTSTALPVSGVIGAAASGSSIAAADLLGLFKVPQISYASTSATLSNKDRYRYFLRTLPPDNFQAEAMMALISALEAKLFSLIYSAGPYGENGAAEIRKAVSAAVDEAMKQDREDVCLAADQIVGATQKRLSSSTYFNVFEKLFGNVGKKASVVVAFTSVDATRNFFNEALKADLPMNLSDHHIWIASDSWANSEHVATSALLHLARGSLGVKPTSSVAEGFEQYFRSLHPNNNTEPSVNPWLSEFWQTEFKCSPNSKDEDERLSCRQHSLHDASYSFQQNPFVPFVVDAVYSFAYAIRHLQVRSCPKGLPGLCPAMLSPEKTRLGAIDGSNLLPLLLNVQFEPSIGHKVAFTSNGDLSTARYDITNLQVDITTGKFHYQKVGLWQGLVPNPQVGPSRRMADGVLTMIHCLPQDTPSQVNCTPAQLNLNLSAIQWRNGSFGAQSMPRSRCSKLCQAGHYAKPLENDPPKFRHCCWMCEQCGENYFTTTQFEACQRCPDRLHGNTNHTGCVDLSEEHWSTDDPGAVVCVLLAVLGIVVSLTTAVVGILWKRVVGRGRDLDVQLLLQCLAGPVGLFASVFMRITKPTVSMCLFSDVWISVSMAALVAPFLVQFGLIIWSNHQGKMREPFEGDQRKRPSSEDGLDVAQETVRQVDDGKTCPLSEECRIDVDRPEQQDGIFLMARSTVIVTGMLLTNLTFTIATAVGSHAKIDENLSINRRLTIACPLQQTAIVGTVFAMCVATAAMLARLYCKRRKIPVQPILSRVGYIMNVFLLLSSTYLVVSSNLSPMAKTATSVFLLLSIAYAFVVIVIGPDLLATLSTKEQRRQLSDRFWVPQSKREGVRGEGTSTEVKETTA